MVIYMSLLLLVKHRDVLFVYYWIICHICDFSVYVLFQGACWAFSG